MVPLRRMGMQSAMEYLMTYGWAILIIAVALGALFSLGVFNGTNFTPRAPPGSCQVFRPLGPLTTTDINLEGECSGVLPQYVGYFSGSGSVSGYTTGSFVNTTVSGVAGSNTPFTVTMWVYTNSNAQDNNMPIFGMQSYQAFELFRCGFGTTGCQLGLHRCTPEDVWATIGPPMSLNTWYFVAVSVNQPNYYFQLDGNGTSLTNGAQAYADNGLVVIGTQTNQCDGEVFSGYISDVQLYNASLSANEIEYIYMEGIGGAPTDLQSLVGWWPLNGNANDYSGEGNNGNAINVGYTSSYLTGYTTP